MNKALTRPASVNPFWVLAYVAGSMVAFGAAAPLCAQTPTASALAEYPLVVEYNVPVPMPDGIELAADVYRPPEGGAFPTIFSFTPYGKGGDGAMAQAWSFVRRGYVYINVDVRGRYDSQGEFVPFMNDRADGNEVLDWIAAQAWSNGEVVTIGGSYLGMNQWLMAGRNNPHHRAIVSYVAPSDGFHDLFRWNGVPKTDLVFTWSMGMDGRVNQARGGWDWGGAMALLPLDELDAAVGRDVAWWREIMREDRLSDYWEPMQTQGTFQDFDIPSFNVSGWFDGQLLGAVKNYTGAVETGEAGDHMLIIGPWLHGVNRGTSIGERDYGPEAVIDLDGLRDHWIDFQVLEGAPPPVGNLLYFLPGKNEWREATRWPIPGTEWTSFHLDSGGQANTLFGDGVLSTEPPGEGGPDEFVYDPSDPVPTVTSRTSGARGGLPQGSVDNRAVQTRQDVLVYTTEPLQEPLEVTGPVKATIYFSTDVPDTDITVKLLDVDPSGRALNITHGIARAKYMDSYESPTLLESGEVYALDVELFPVSNYFHIGHQIRLEVSSSDAPNFSRNLNTGNSDTGTEMRTATTRIYHEPGRMSHIVLPVVPHGASARWDPQEIRTW